MPDRSMRPNQPAPEATPRREVNDAHQQNLLEHFGVLLARLGGLLASMIGADAADAVLRSALLTTRRAHPLLRDLEVSEVGGQVEQLQTQLGHIDDDELQNSLSAYIDDIVALVADITGEVLVVKITPLVHQFQQRLEG